MTYLASMAKLKSGRLTREVADTCLQYWGGMGFTWEFDCHLYYRRCRQLAANIGSQAIWKDKLINSLERANQI